MTGLLVKDCPSFCKRLYYIHPRRKVLRQFFSGIAVVLFFKQNGLLQQSPEVSVASQQNALPLAGIDRLANQLNVVLGQNATNSY